MRRLLIFVVLLLLPLAAFSALDLPWVEEALARRAALWAEAKGASIRVAGVDLDPWRFRVRVNGLEARGPEGAWSVCLPRGEVRLHVWKTLFGRLRLSAVLRSPRVSVTVPSAAPPSGGGRGLPQLPLFETLRITDGRLAVKSRDGSFHLRMAGIRSDWERGAGVVEVRSGSLVWRGEEERLDHLVLHGRARWASLDVDRFELRTSRLGAEVSGTLGAWSGLRLDVRLTVDVPELPASWAEAWRLGRFLPIGGRIGAEARIEGPASAPRATGTFTARNVRFGPVRSGEADGRFQADRSGIRVADVVARSNVGGVEGLNGSFRRRSGTWFLEARGRARGFSLRPFMALFVKRWFPVGLRAEGAFSVAGPVHPRLALRAEIDARAGELDVSPGSPGRTVFALEGGRVRGRCTVGREELLLEDMRVEGPGVTVRIPEGAIRYREGLWFDTEVAFERLDAARRWIPPGLRAAGTARGRFGGPYRELAFDYRVDARVSWNGQALGRLTAKARWNTGSMAVEEALLEGPLGRMRASGDLSWKQQPWALRVEGAGLDLGKVLGLAGGTLPGTWGVQGQVELAGAVEGVWPDPVFRGEVRVRELAVRGFRAQGVRVRGEASLERWRADRFECRAYGGRVRGRAEGAGPRGRIEARVEGLDLGSLVRAASGPPFGGRFDGNVRLVLGTDGPEAGARGRIRDAEFRGFVLGTVEGAAGWAGGRASWDARLWDGRLRVSGEAETAPGGEWKARIEASGLETGQLPVALPRGLFLGRLSGSGTLRGEIGQPAEKWEAAWEGRFSGIRVQGVALGEAAVSADWRGRGLEFAVDAAAGALKIQGLFSLEEGRPAEVRVLIDGFDLARFPGWKGRLEAGEIRALVSTRDLVEAAGAPDVLEAVASVRGRVRWQGVEGPGGVALPAGVLSVEGEDGRVRAEVDGEGLRGVLELAGPAQAAWSASLDLNGVPVALLLPEHLPGGPYRGRVRAAVRARGRGLAADTASVRADLTGMRAGVYRLGDWEISGSLSDGLVNIRARSGRGITARGSGRPAGPWEGVISLDDVPLDGWVESPRWPQDLTGTVRGTVRILGGPGEGLRAEAVLPSVRAELPPLRLKNREPVRLAWDGERFRVDRMELSGEGFRVSVRGTAGPASGWDLEGRAEGDLSVLPRWVGVLRTAAGRARARARVAGPWDTPRVEATAQVLPGAEVEIRGVAVPFTDVDASVRLEPVEGLLLEWFDAQFGPGRVHVEGRVALDGFRPGQLQLWAELRDVAYEAPLGVTYGGDADLMVAGPLRSVRISGEVRLERFLYSLRVSWQDMVANLLRRKPKAVEQAGREREGPRLDLVVRGDRDIRVRNNLADLELAVRLRVQGPVTDPVLWGDVEVLRGEVRLRGVRYDVARSSVEFAGEVRRLPLLDIHARAEVSGYRVNVDVTGPLESYEVLLSSSPPLPRTDIVALLTLGTTSEDLGGEGIAAAAAADLLTGQVQEVLETGMGGVFRLDEFQIDPAYSPSAQTTVPRITVGKAITRNLYARYAATVGGETLQDMELRYSLTPNVSVLGTWTDRGSESRGSVGGEVRFRFTFR